MLFSFYYYPKALTTLIAFKACSAYPALYPYARRLYMVPAFKAFPETCIPNEIIGKQPNITNAKDHPLVNPTRRPDMHIKFPKTMVPIFSPTAF